MKRIFSVVLAIIVLLLIGLSYVYKSHRSVAKENPVFQGTTTEFTKQFFKNTEESELKFQDKVVELSGKITSVNSSSLVLGNSVRCYPIASFSAALNVDDKVTIKGRCLGYDELMEEIKLDQCTLIYNN